MAKLPNGVRKREGGGYEKRFTCEGRRCSVYGKTVKEVQAKELEKREEIKKYGYLKNADITLDEYFLEWEKGREGHVTLATMYHLRGAYKNHFKKPLGKLKVRQIERRQIIDLQQRMLESGMKPASINQEITLLNTLFKAAVADEIVSRNPVENVKRLKDTGEKITENRHRALTREEQAAFLKAAEREWLYPFLLFAFYSGCRVGEIAALKWGDIDLVNNSIHIMRTATIDLNGTTIIGTGTKTKGSRRDIPINAQLRRALTEQKQQMLKLFGGNALMLDQLVFLSVQGNIVCSPYVSAVIRRVVKRAEQTQGVHIDPFTVHATRDTFATRFLEDGGTMQTLKALLGHGSYAMTADLYAHVLPNTKQEEMNRMTEVI